MRDNSGIKELKHNDRDTISSILMKLEEKYPSKVKAMKTFFAKSSKNVPFFEYKIVSQLIRCNFAANDPCTPDLDEKGNFHFENYFCPLRGVCSMEGVFCHPAPETSLSNREMEVLSLLHSAESIDSIADKLFLSRKTICRHIENIKKKLNLHTMPELLSWYNTNML